MADVGAPPPLQGWQRANVVTATIYLRELLTRTPDDVWLRAVHDGLVETLDPARRGVRLQRESHAAAAAAKTAVRVDKRHGADRRSGDRRIGIERRAGERRKGDRRADQDRRRR